MTITAEQVARAIEVARADEGGISDALGGWQWDKRAPDYVRVAWGKPSLPDFIAALIRWHAELVAAETPRKVARWDARVGVYALTPPHAHDSDIDGLGVQRSATRGEAIAWGYTIEGGPEPVDDTAPERLRERRERADAAQAARMQRDAADYAAALSAAEAERPAKPDHLAYADSPVWDDGPLPTPTPEHEPTETTDVWRTIAADASRDLTALITRLRAAEARTAELRAGLERVVKRCAEGGEQALAEAQCALDWDDDTHKEAPHV